MGNTYQKHYHTYHLVHVGDDWGLFCFGCGMPAKPGETIPFREIVDYDRVAVMELLEASKYHHEQPRQDREPV